MHQKNQVGSNNHSVFIITGNPQSGKTTFLSGIVERLKSGGFACGGFSAPGTFEHGVRARFDIVDLKSGHSRPLCAIDFENGEKIGAFTFSPEGQTFGKNLIRPENILDVDFVVVDEIGPLELRGGGWADSLAALLKTGHRKMIWVVRKSLVDEVMKKFHIREAVVLAVDEIEIDDAVTILTGN